MRITFLLETAYALFGSIQATLTTASALASRGHAVEVVSVFRTRTTPHHRFDPAVPVVPLIDVRCEEASPDSREGAGLHAPSVILPGDHPLRAPYDRRTDAILAEYLASLPADVVVSAWPALHYYLAALAPESLVTVAHDHLLYDYYSPAIRAGLRSAYAQLDGVVAVAARAAAIYREHFPELAERIHHIPNAVLSLGIPKSATDAKLVIAAGRLNRMKRFDHLIAAFAQVVREHPDWSLRIYGDGPERERLRALIAERRLYDHVFLMGARSPMEPEWVKGSIGVLTSEAESFGLVILEAMQAGLPVIATDCPVGPRELIDHGVDGLLVQPGDVAAIAAAIARLIASPAERRSMAAGALEKADLFSADRAAAQHEELYSSLLRAKARAGQALRAGRAGTAACSPSPPGDRPPASHDDVVTCIARSATELELLVEGAGAMDEALLTHARSGETLRIARSGFAGGAARFRIAVDDLPAGATGTWSLTVAGRAPHLKFIDDRRLAAELAARSGRAEALLPIDRAGTLKVHAIVEPSRAQLISVSWAGEVLSLTGVLLGDGWRDRQVEIDTAVAGSRRFTVRCVTSGAGSSGDFSCSVDTAGVYALLGEGSWKVWLADAAKPWRRIRIGRVVSDLRDPGRAVLLPSAILAGVTEVTEVTGAAGEAVRIRPRYSRTGLLMLEVGRVDEPAASPDAVSIPAETNPAGRWQI